MTRSHRIFIGTAALVFATAGMATAQNNVKGGGIEPETFGHAMIHLGMTPVVSFGFTPAGTTCDEPQPDVCVVMNASPAMTRFSYPDLTRIVIPAGSTQSIVYPMFHHVIHYELLNDTSVPQPNAVFQFNTLVTLESDALLDPSLINPDTGQPFNGSYQVSFAPPEGVNRSLSVGERIYQMSRLGSTGNYLFDYQFFRGLGLSDKVVKKIFQGRITLHLGFKGATRLTSGAFGNFSMRLIGDGPTP